MADYAYATKTEVEELTGLSGVTELEVKQATMDLDIWLPLHGESTEAKFGHKLDPSRLLYRQRYALLIACAEQVRYRRTMPPEVFSWTPATSTGPDYKRSEPIPRIAPAARAAVMSHAPGLIRSFGHYGSRRNRLPDNWFTTAADEDC